MQSDLCEEETQACLLQEGDIGPIYIHDSQPCISSEEVGGEAGTGGW